MEHATLKKSCHNNDSINEEQIQQIPTQSEKYKIESQNQYKNYIKQHFDDFYYDFTIFFTQN